MGVLSQQLQTFRGTHLTGGVTNRLKLGINFSLLLFETKRATPQVLGFCLVVTYCKLSILSAGSKAHGRVVGYKSKAHLFLSAVSVVYHRVSGRGLEGAGQSQLVSRHDLLRGRVAAGNSIKGCNLHIATKYKHDLLRGRVAVGDSIKDCNLHIAIIYKHDLLRGTVAVGDSIKDCNLHIAIKYKHDLLRGTVAAGNSIKDCNLHIAIKYKHDLLRGTVAAGNSIKDCNLHIAIKYHHHLLRGGVAAGNSIKV